jgi:peroxiredoxin
MTEVNDTLAPQLASVWSNLKANAPSSVVDKIQSSRSDLIGTWDASQVIKVGARLPSFTLPNATGDPISSESLLVKGPLLICYYRGEWCPFCNFELMAYQKRIGVIHSKGAQLVAISPELPDTNTTMTEKHSLKYPVLSDKDLFFAHKLGIVWEQPAAMRGIFSASGTDQLKRTGRDTLELPVPATMLVGKDGLVKNIWADPDYTTRLEPTAAITWIDEVNRSDGN